MIGKTNTRDEDCELVPIQMTFGDPDKLSPDFGDNSIFLMEGAMEGEEDEEEEEDEPSEEEILVMPLSRQISPLPSLKSSGPSSASRTLLHMCLQCNQASTSLQPLVTCGACSLAEYCSIECQALHRPLHRNTCSQIVKLLRRLYQGPLGRRQLRKIFLDEGDFQLCEPAVAVDIDEVCTRYIKPLCSAYWEEGWKTLTARPVQEALLWHERMLRARAHAAERGFGRGMLDAVLGGRTAELTKPVVDVDVKWASIWTLTDREATAGEVKKRTKKPNYNNLVNCLLALGSFQEASAFLKHWSEPNLVAGGAWRGEVLGHLSAWEEKQRQGFSLDPSSQWSLPPQPSPNCFCASESLVVVLWQLIVLHLEVIRAREERNEVGREELAALLSTPRAQCLFDQPAAIARIAHHLGCGDSLAKDVECQWREVESLVSEVEQAEGEVGDPGEVGAILDMLPFHISAQLGCIAGWDDAVLV